MNESLLYAKGCGKSSTAKLLSEKLKYEFADADGFHSAENKQLMSSGIPLTDENRQPWLKSLHDHLLSWQDRQLNGVLACSALKVKYRQLLSQDLKDVKFVLLNVKI